MKPVYWLTTGERQGATPPYLRRRLWHSRRWIAVSFLLVAILLYIYDGFSSSGYAPWLRGSARSLCFVVIGVLPGAVVWLIGRGQRSRMNRLLSESDGCRCVGCFHDVHGLGDTGRCPECGAEFDVARDGMKWLEAGLRW